MLQNAPAGANALGGSGASLGYHLNGVQPGISNGVAVEFNIYTTNTVGSTLRTDGILQTVGPYTPTTPVALAGGHPIQVSLIYNGTILTETLTDTITSQTYSTSYTINVGSTVGASTAYVGFTGGTGSNTSTQTIRNFTFGATPEPGSVALFGGLVLAGTLLAKRRKRR